MHRQHQQQPGLACRAYFSECVWYPFGRHHSSTYQRCLDGGSWRVVVECLAPLKIDEPLDFSLASFTWPGLTTLWSELNLCLKVSDLYLSVVILTFKQCIAYFSIYIVLTLVLISTTKEHCAFAEISALRINQAIVLTEHVFKIMLQSVF